METVQAGVGKQSMAAVVKGVTQQEWWRAVRVRDIMTSPVICVDSTTPVTEAQMLMRERKIRRLPVINDGKLVGILTQGDVRGAMPSEVTTLNRTEQDYLIKHVKVDRVMTGDVIVANSAMNLAEAARLLVQYKISGLPVVDDDQVIGMVTESDIFGVVVAMFDKLDQI